MNLLFVCIPQFNGVRTKTEPVAFVEAEIRIPQFRGRANERVVAFILNGCLKI